MATQNDYDGLQVHTSDTQSSLYSYGGAGGYYKPQPAEDAKEVTTADFDPLSQKQFYTPSQIPAGHSYRPQPRSQRNPWGLSPFAFAGLVALITAVIVGGAVGGGVSAALNSNKKCSPASGASVGNTNTSTGTSTSSSSTSTSTAAPTGIFTNYVPPRPDQVQSLATDCSSLNGSTIISGEGAYFRLSCPQAILGSSGSDGVTLSELVAYSLQDCVDACSLMNFWKGSTVCNSVTWDSGMSEAAAANSGGNCWLFDNSGTWQVKANSTSARLETS